MGKKRRISAILSFLVMFQFLFANYGYINAEAEENNTKVIELGAHKSTTSQAINSSINTTASSIRLEEGQHLMKIIPMGIKNEKSKKIHIIVDSFEIIKEDGSIEIIEENDPRIVYSGAWSDYSKSKLSEGQAKLSKDPSAYLEFVFEGKGIKWKGYTNSYRGKAIVEIDETSEIADCYSAASKYGAVIFEKLLGGEVPAEGIELDKSEMNLSVGVSEKLTAKVLPEDATNQNIIWSSNDDGIATVDADGNVTAVAEGSTVITAITVEGNYSANCTVNVTEELGENVHKIKISATDRKNALSKSTHVLVDRFDIVKEDGTSYSIEENDPRIKYVGAWTDYSKSKLSGGVAKLTRDPNAYMELVFEGVSIKWIGYKNDYRGIAIVDVDGSTEEVDGYYKTGKYSAVIFNKDFGEKGHKIKISATDRKNSKSKSTHVLVDRFDIVKEDGTSYSIEENDPRIKYVGAWTDYSKSKLSGGLAKMTRDPNAYMEFVFDGVSIKWIGYKNDYRGIAIVDVDGSTEEVDGYYKTGKYNVVIFSKDFKEGVLAEGIQLDKSELNLIVGTVDRITAKVLPEDATNKNVIWSSADESIVTVSAEGNIAAMAEGRVVITAITEDGNHSAECIVNVTAELGENDHIIKISATDRKNTESKSTHVLIDRFDIMGEDGSIYSMEENDPRIKYVGKWVDYKKSKLSGGIAKMTSDPNAYMQFIFEGVSFEWIGYKNDYRGIALVEIDGATEEVDGYSKSSEYNVTIFSKEFKTIIPVESIELDKSEINLLVGEVDKIVAKVLPEEATIKTVYWGSSDDNIVTVDEDGNITAVAEGSAVILVASADTKQSAVCRVNVTRILGENEHRIEIKPTGNKNVDSKSAYIILDKFEITKEDGTVEIIEENDPRIKYVGSWIDYSKSYLSGGNAKMSKKHDAYLEIIIEGKVINWIGYTNEYRGVAEIIIDGEREFVDCYSEASNKNATIYTKSFGEVIEPDTVVLETEGGADFVDIENIYVSGGGKSYFDYNSELEIEKVEINGNTQIKIKGFDFSEGKEYDVWFRNKMHYIKSHITHENNEKITDATIANGEFIKIDVQVENTSDNFSVKGINLHQIWNDGTQQDTAYLFGTGYYIPVGNYNMQINAEDDENVYNMIKLDYDVRQNDGVITFTQEQLKKLTVTRDEELSKFEYSLSPRYFWSTFSMRINDKNILLSKISYQELVIMMSLNNGILQYNNINPAADEDIQMNLSSDLSFIITKEKFESGEDIRFSRFLEIKDINNNDVGFEGAERTLELEYKKDGIIEKTESFVIRNKYDNVKIADVNGRYDLTVRLLDDEINVKSMQMTVEIGDVIEETDAISFIVDNFDGRFEVEGISAYNESYYNLDGTIYSLNCSSEVVGNMRVLNVSDIQWNGIERYTFWIVAGEHHYRMDVTPGLLGKTIMLNNDPNGFVQLTTNKPELENAEITLFIKDSQDSYFTAIKAYPGQYVPKGTYGIQVNAYHSEKSYSLVKESYDLVDTAGKINFSDDEILEIKVDIDEEIKVGRNSVFGARFFNHDYNAIHVKAGNIILSKIEYKDLVITLENENGAVKYHNRGIMPEEGLILRANKNIQLNLYKYNFNAGEEIKSYKFMDFSDENGTLIDLETRGEGYLDIKFIFTNKVTGNVYEEHLSRNYGKLNIPSVPGEYSLEITTTFAELDIPTVTSDINVIGDSQGITLSTERSDLIYVTNVYYENQEGDWDYRFNEELNIENSEDGDRSKVKIDGFDWDRGDKYYVWLKNGNHNIKVEVTKDMEGTEIDATIANNLFEKIAVDIEGSESLLNIQSINFHKIWDNGSMVNIGDFSENDYIPAAIYKMQVNASDASNVYSLIKLDYDMGAMNGLIEFKETELKRVNLDLDEKLNELNNSLSARYFWSTSSINREGRNIVLSKMQYNEIVVDFSLDNSYLGYSIYQNNPDSDITASLSSDLRFAIKKEQVSPGEMIRFKEFIEVRDANENEVIFGGYNKTVMLEFEYAKNGVAIESNNFSINSMYQKITIPNLDGEYDLTVRLHDDNLNIQEATRKITIGNSSSADSEVTLSIDSSFGDIRLENISSDDIETWEIWEMKNKLEYEQSTDGSKKYFKIKGLDWNKTDSYTLWMVTGNYHQGIVVHKENNGQLIELDENKENFVQLTSNLEYVNYGEIYLLKKNKSGNTIRAMSAAIGKYVQKGTYSVQISSDGSSVEQFTLIKDSVDLASTNGMISFEEDEIVEVEINIADKLKEFNNINMFPIYFNSTSGVYINEGTMSMSKVIYDRIDVSFNSDNGYIGYDMENVDVKEGLTLNYGVPVPKLLKTEFEFEENIKLEDLMKITDQFDNKIEINEFNDEAFKVLIKFIENGTGNVYKIEANNMESTIAMPTVDSNYTMEMKLVLDGVTISEKSFDITVGNVLVNNISIQCDDEINVGDTFEINVMAKDIEDLYGASIDLKLDSEYLEVLDITRAEILKGNENETFQFDKTDAETNIKSKGMLYLGNVAGENVDSNKKMFVITVRALKVGSVTLDITDDYSEVVGGDSNICIKLANSSNNSNKIEYGFQNGVIQIK